MKLRREEGFDVQTRPYYMAFIITRLRITEGLSSVSPVAEEAISDFSVQPFPMSQNGSYSERNLSASLQNDKAQPQAESLMGQERATT